MLNLWESGEDFLKIEIEIEDNANVENWQSFRCAETSKVKWIVVIKMNSFFES